MDKVDQDRLAELDEAIQKARHTQEARSKSSHDPGKRARNSSIGIAYRIVTELIAGVAVGCGIGYMLDRWLDSTPWGFLVFFFLGCAAGIMNVIRYLSHGVPSTADAETSHTEHKDSSPRE